MNMKDEKWWLLKSELLFEEELKKRLRSVDPGKIDVSETFFTKIHQEVMAKIDLLPPSENKKIQNKKSANEKQIKI